MNEHRSSCCGCVPLGYVTLFFSFIATLSCLGTLIGNMQSQFANGGKPEAINWVQDFLWLCFVLLVLLALVGTITSSAKHLNYGALACLICCIPVVLSLILIWVVMIIGTVHGFKDENGEKRDAGAADWISVSMLTLLWALMLAACLFMKSVFKSAANRVEQGLSIWDVEEPIEA